MSFTSVSLGTLERQCAWSIAQGAGNRIGVSMGSCSVDFGLEDTTSGQIWYSDDNGATWSQSAGVAAASGVGRITVASSPANRNVMYAAAAIPGSVSADDLADFFRSSDGGATWTAMGASARRVAYTNRNRESAGPRTLFNGQGWYDQLVLPSQTDQNVVYVGGALLLVRIDNALSATPTYTQVTNWLAQFGLPYVHADFHAGATTADGRIYVGNDGGVFMSSDNGATWTDRYNVGITSHLLYALGSTEAPGAENAIIGGFQDNGTRVRAGATSTYNQEIGGDGFGANIHPLNGNLMLGSLYNTRIYKSTDGGLNFSAATTGIREAGTGSAPFLTRIVPYLGDATGNTLFTHVNLKVYKSTNYAGKWSALGTTGFITSGSIRNIGVKVNDSNYVGAVASGGRVWVTTNGGTSWTQTTNATDNALSMNSIWFDVANPTTIFVSSVAPDGNAPHLWKSADLGQTWTKLGDCDGATGTGLDCGLPVNTVYGDPTDANVLYLGTHLGVYKSSDGGAHWSRFGSGMPLVNIMDFYISPSGKMRAASYGRGFWQLN